MVTVLASESTPRLTYVLNFVFGIGNYRVVEAVSTTDINDITLCYTEEPCDAGIHIKPAGLIEERRHRVFTPQYAVIDSLPVLFPAPDTALGFDVFSALFYVLSRYEE